MTVDRVLLLRYPVALGARQQEHLDEVVREFVLLTLSAPEARAGVPGRLLEIVEQITTSFAAELEEPRRRREEALARGDEHVDLVYPAVPGAREIVTGWERVMREVDAYCRTDDLLSLATPPEVVALQRWVVEQFLVQLDGGQATPWPGVQALHTGFTGRSTG